MTDANEKGVATDDSMKVMALSESLLVQQIEQKFEELHQIVETASELKLDLTGLTEIDTSGYQLLVSLVKYCEKYGKSLRFSKVTPELFGVLRLFGDQILLAQIKKTN